MKFSMYSDFACPGCNKMMDKGCWESDKQYVVVCATSTCQYYRLPFKLPQIELEPMEITKQTLEKREQEYFEAKSW